MHQYFGFFIHVGLIKKSLVYFLSNSCKFNLHFIKSVKITYTIWIYLYFNVFRLKLTVGGRVSLKSRKCFALLIPQISRRSLYEGIPWSRPLCVFSATKSMPKLLTVPCVYFTSKNIRLIGIFVHLQGFTLVYNRLTLDCGFK